MGFCKSFYAKMRQRRKPEENILGENEVPVTLIMAGAEMENPTPTYVHKPTPDTPKKSGCKPVECICSKCAICALTSCFCMMMLCILGAMYISHIGPVNPDTGLPHAWEGEHVVVEEWD